VANQSKWQHSVLL